MRNYGLTLLASVAVLSACGGGGDQAADTASATPTPAAAAAVAVVPAMPITGTTHEVKMIGDATFRFDPVDITIKTGDGIRFVTVSGQPHNVAFKPLELPPAVRAQLKANMENQTMELQSPVILAVGDSYTVSFGGVAPGKYTIDCPLHLAMGMKGSVTVTP